MPPLDLIKEKIRTIPDFPKPGIQFRDTTTLIQDPEGFRMTIDALCNNWKDVAYDGIIAIDARGFIFGSAMAYQQKMGLILARKKGKLPYEKITQEYQLEYGTDAIEMHRDAIQPGHRYLIIDDLIATGGTAKAACEIVSKLGGHIAGCGFVIELQDLPGRNFLAPHLVKSLITY